MTPKTPKDLVEQAIAAHQIVIFSKSWCPYCQKAKGLLQSKYGDADSITYELDELDNGSEIQQYLHQKTNQRTVPNIFIAQKHIGGCDDVFEAEKQGRIAPLLK